MSLKAVSLDDKYTLEEGRIYITGTQALVRLPMTQHLRDRQEGKSTAVWVLDKATMTVKSQPVQVATADGNEAVIAAGVQPGMTVVAAGVHVLAPGQKVTVWQERTGAPSPLIAQEATKSMAGTAQAAQLPAVK